MSTPERRGLGRGLGAIIRDTASTVAPAALPVDGQAEPRAVDEALVARLAEVGLDLIDGPDLTHLGYLHQPLDRPPQLVLRRPCLGELSPTTSYRLLTGLDRAAGDPDQIRYTELDGTALSFIPSRGPYSTGVHLVGSTHPLEPRRRTHLERTCRAVAQIVHQLHREIEDDGLVTVDTEVEDGTIVARARLDRADATPAEGEARDPDLATAVARAIVSAHDNGLVHRTTRAISVDGGRRAVLTVLTDSDGQPRLGFTLSEAPQLEVAASATRRAIGG